MPTIDGQHEYRQLAAAVFANAKKDLVLLRRDIAWLEANERIWIERWIERYTKILNTAHRAAWRKRTGGGTHAHRTNPFVKLTKSQIRASAGAAYRGRLASLRSHREEIYDLFSGPSLWSDILAIDDVSTIFKTLGNVLV